MYAKSTRPSAKREVQKERSAKRDDQIARLSRAQTCERNARWECARKAGRFFFLFLKLYLKMLFSSLEKTIVLYLIKKFEMIVVILTSGWKSIFQRETKFLYHLSGHIEFAIKALQNYKLL